MELLLPPELANNPIADLFYSKPVSQSLPHAVVPAPAVVLAERQPDPLPAVERPRKLEPFQGYVNSCTWHRALMLSNSAKHSKAIRKMVRLDGTINPRDIQVYYESLPAEPGWEEDEDLEWIEGEVDWQEVAGDFTCDIQAGCETGLLSHLSTAVIDGNVVRLVSQLDRDSYQKVNKILEGLGGKWKKAAKGHVFDEDPSELIDTFLLTGRFPDGAIDPKKTFGFFETPVPKAKDVVVRADIRPGMTVLEPNAGGARLASLAAEIVGIDSVKCVEIQPSLVSALREKGYSVIEADFLTLEPNQDDLVERVVMNPPFQKRSDILHVMHAAKWLKPGGKLVAIMSAGITNRQDRLATQFAAFLEEHSGVVTPNAANTFKESGTSVSSVTVELIKPF